MDDLGETRPLRMKGSCLDFEPISPFASVPIIRPASHYLRTVNATSTGAAGNAEGINTASSLWTSNTDRLVSLSAPRRLPFTRTSRSHPRLMHDPLVLRPSNSSLLLPSDSVPLYQSVKIQKSRPLAEVLTCSPVHRARYGLERAKAVYDYSGFPCAVGN